MKRLLSLFLATCLLLACVMAFSSCGEPPTEGLEYEFFALDFPDWACSVSVGSATEVEHIVIPAKIDGQKVTVITSFMNCTSLKKITIPNSVEGIATHAFKGCTSLESITIPKGVTEIGIYTFYGCTSLESITIPASVTSIGAYAFAGCTSLESITIPEGVTEIGDYAFAGCTSLKSITIPESVTSIGAYAFAGCTSLTTVTFENPNGWKSGNLSIFPASELSDPYVAAEYLTSIYALNDWTRK